MYVKERLNVSHFIDNIPAVKITLFMMIIRHSFEKIGYFLNGIVTLRYTMYQQKMCIHARQKTVAKLIKILTFFRNGNC